MYNSIPLTWQSCRGCKHTGQSYVCLPDACSSDNTSTMKGTLVALSSLAPQYLLSQCNWQAKHHRLKPQSHSDNGQRDVAPQALSGQNTPDGSKDCSELASQIEVLNVLVSLLEGASGTLGLLLAASLFRLASISLQLARQQWTWSLHCQTA